MNENREQKAHGIDQSDIITFEAKKPSIMKGITKPGIENFTKLISAEHYAVPRFQRDYSWKEAHWFELWQDIKSILKGDYEERYMGYLVFLQKGKINEIIDGQQRLTTISILILAFIENINRLRNQDADADRRIQLLKSRYIADEGIKKGDYKIKLHLNENNNDLYVSFINNNPLSRRKLNSSENLMKKCLTWFTDKVPELKLNGSEELANAVENIADSLYFTTLQVTDDINAYIVFETLNARGLKLSSTDLLKNYLFQKVSTRGEVLLNDVEGKWRRIVNIIGSEDLVDFIRYYWNSRNKIVRKVDLYRAITLFHDTADSVIKLVDDLLTSATIYTALNNPQDDYWKGNEKMAEKLRTLKIFRVKQPLVPLMIAKETLNDKLFEKLLNYCVSLSLRYNVICDFSTNEQEFFYNDLAISIKKNKTFSESDFKKIYPLENEFHANFINKAWVYTAPNMKLVRYLLGSIEKVLSENKKAIDLFSPELTIEHIMPLSPSDEWNIDADEHKRLVNRLGNLTLLSKSEQKKTSDHKFETKLMIYKKSSYKITNEIIGTSKNGWDRDMIEQRQEWLFKKAKSIWYIPNI